MVLLMPPSRPIPPSAMLLSSISKLLMTQLVQSLTRKRRGPKPDLVPRLVTPPALKPAVWEVIPVTVILLPVSTIPELPMVAWHGTRTVPPDDETALRAA